MSAPPATPEDHLAGVRAEVLAAALPHAPFTGWSANTLQIAIQEAGADPGLALLAFPDGEMSLLEAFWSTLDAALTHEIAARALANTPLSQRIAIILKTYIALLRPHREAVRRALALQAMPLNAPHGLACLYRTVDAMWRAAGDASNDFNFYTKRATLAAVTASVVTHWLGEGGDDAGALDSFIDRRINDILRFEKFKAGAGRFLQGLPQPATVLGRIAGIVSGTLSR